MPSSTQPDSQFAPVRCGIQSQDPDSDVLGGGDIRARDSGLYGMDMPRQVGAGQAFDHLILMLCMWGIAAGFVHGVGFVPFKCWQGRFC